ncbi:hypothetical protein EYF80_000855 [Liparis tanakae]|uniref:Uncharacterized protein n=1 Tax=Liparis tanakae TaxID=230148 RepID=A0A4Z2JGB3_9TELE|nr:hypothetical protein EYF80_000855 [Liparis tanakae]
MLNGRSNVMTFRVNASLPATDALASDGISRYSPHGPDAAKYLPYRNSGMRAGGGQCSNGRRKLPVIQPLSSKSPNLASEVRLEPDNNDSNMDICGRRFLFDDPFLNGRNTFTVENCKLSRPSVKYPTTPNLPSVKDYQKSQSYPDPVVGASRSFIHRVFELSSLEGETYSLLQRTSTLSSNIDQTGTTSHEWSNISGMHETVCQTDKCDGKRKRLRLS